MTRVGLAVVSALALSATVARGQNVFSLLGTGAEAKASAGAGTTTSRGAPSNFYNPANLIETRGSYEPYAELAVASFSWRYEYPGYFPIEVKRAAPIPFFGMTFRPLPSLFVAFSALPLPPSSAEQELENLPTRKFTEEPILVDVATKGKGFGYRLSLGAAYKVMSGLGVGLSILANKGGSELSAKDAQSGNEIAVDTNESSSYEFIVGVRASALKGRVNAVLAVNPPATSQSEGKTVLPPFDNAEIPKESSSKGPLGLTAGVDGEVAWGFRPFVELTQRQWGALREQEGQAGISTAKFDYFDTLDAAFGAEWRTTPHRMTLAYGAYQSPLGEGIMASQAPDEVELIGMEFQNLDAMPHSRLAAGYRFDFESSYLQGAITKIAGDREVWEKARGYGSYELNVLLASVAGAWRF